MIARVAPQSNVFMLSFPVNFMIGIFVLSLIIFSMYYLLVDNYFSVDFLGELLANVLKNMANK
ncbi:MAG: flagellar biosynthetic protein FliR [bacterium]